MRPAPLVSMAGTWLASPQRRESLATAFAMPFEQDFRHRPDHRAMGHARRDDFDVSAGETRDLAAIDAEEVWVFKLIVSTLAP